MEATAIPRSFPACHTGLLPGTPAVRGSPLFFTGDWSDLAAVVLSLRLPHCQHATWPRFLPPHPRRTIPRSRHSAAVSERLIARPSPTCSVPFACRSFGTPPRSRAMPLRRTISCRMSSSSCGRCGPTSTLASRSRACSFAWHATAPSTSNATAAAEGLSTTASALRMNPPWLQSSALTLTGSPLAFGHGWRTYLTASARRSRSPAFSI